MAPTLLGALRERAEALETELYALSLAYRDPRTPWYARAWALLVVGYAVSPIDLIPDVIPVVGYLDDLVLVPLGILIALRLIPRDVLEESRRRAREATRVGPGRWVGIAIVATLWLLLLGGLLWAGLRVVRR